MSLDRRRAMIEADHPGLSIVRQCELVAISRSGFYGTIRNFVRV
jgi:putative transposase